MKPVTRRELLGLAAPAAASTILNNAWRVIGQEAVSDLGVASQAAVGSCIFVLIANYAIYATVFAGTGPLVARAAGAGDGALTRRVIGNSIVASVGLALLSGAALALFAPDIASLLGLEGAAAAQAVIYLRGVAAVGVPLAIEPALDAAFIAMGRTGLAMGCQAVAVVVNVALNDPFIHGLGMGVGGAPAATGVARVAAVILGLIAMRRLTGLGWADLRLDATIRRITRVGLPICLNTLAYSLVYWALLRWAVSPLGPEVNAALGVGFSALEGFTWPLFFGISLGLSSAVGRRLGAGEPDQAERAVRLALPMSLVAGGLSAMAFWFLAEPLCGYFTDDRAVLEQAVLYAHILGFSQVFVALEALAEGALEGAGDTRTVFWWSAPINAARVPLGWLLAIPLGYGAAGIWWAINLTTFAKVLGKGGAVLRGGWVRTII